MKLLIMLSSPASCHYFYTQIFSSVHNQYVTDYISYLYKTGHVIDLNDLIFKFSNWTTGLQTRIFAILHI